MLLGEENERKGKAEMEKCPLIRRAIPRQRGEGRKRSGRHLFIDAFQIFKLVPGKSSERGKGESQIIPFAPVWITTTFLLKTSATFYFVSASSGCTLTDRTLMASPPACPDTVFPLPPECLWRKRLSLLTLRLSCSLSTPQKNGITVILAIGSSKRRSILILKIRNITRNLLHRGDNQEGRKDTLTRTVLKKRNKPYRFTPLWVKEQSLAGCWKTPINQSWTG